MKTKLVKITFSFIFVITSYSIHYTKLYEKSSGKFTDVAPVGGGFGGLLWGSAGLTVAWETS